MTLDEEEQMLSRVHPYFAMHFKTTRYLMEQISAFKSQKERACELLSLSEKQAELRHAEQKRREQVLLKRIKTLELKLEGAERFK